MIPILSYQFLRKLTPTLKSKIKLNPYLYILYTTGNSYLPHLEYINLLYSVKDRNLGEIALKFMLNKYHIYTK